MHLTVETPDVLASTPARQQENARLIEAMRHYYATQDEALLNPVLATVRPALRRFLRYKEVKNLELIEDMLQESLVNILLSLRKRQFALRGSFVTWANTICWHTFCNYYQTKHNHITTPGFEDDPFGGWTDVYAAAHSYAPEDSSAEDRAHQCLQAVTAEVLKLAEPDRRVLEAYYYQGMTVVEACAHLGLSYGEFMPRFVRGRKALREWAQRNPHLALGAEELAALPRVDTGALFDEGTWFERMEKQKNPTRSAAYKEKHNAYQREKRKEKRQQKARERRLPATEASEASEEYWSLAA